MNTVLFLLFFFYYYAHHRDLHSFPTRRSSDLDKKALVFDLLEPDPVGKLLKAHRSGRQDNHKLLFSLIMSLEKDRKSTRLNSSHQIISYAVFCLKKKTGDIGN